MKRRSTDNPTETLKEFDFNSIESDEIKLAKNALLEISCEENEAILPLEKKTQEILDFLMDTKEEKVKSEESKLEIAKKKIFDLSHFGFSEKKAFNEVFQNEDSTILIKNGIIFARSHLSLIPHISRTGDLIILTLINEENEVSKVRIESGTLLILVQDTNNIIKKECDLTDTTILELLNTNTHLMHNGIWWVNVAKPKNIVKDKKYKTIRKLKQLEN